MIIHVKSMGVISFRIARTSHQVRLHLRCCTVDIKCTCKRRSAYSLNPADLSSI